MALYKLGAFYLVIDGHHRVSVATALGFTDVDANVTELRTRKPADSLSVNDLAALAMPVHRLGRPTNPG